MKAINKIKELVGGLKQNPTVTESKIEEQKRELERASRGMGAGVNVPYVKVLDDEGNIMNPITYHNPYLHFSAPRKTRRKMRRIVMKMAQLSQQSRQS
mgnify:CR=1 FL=1